MKTAFRLRVFPTLVLLFALSACGTPYVPPPPVIDASDKTEIVEVLNAGFGGVTEKYIDVVSAESVAMEGMRGLGSIDPNLGITRNGPTIQLMNGDADVVAFDAPGTDDIEGWANTTADVVVAAQRVSVDLRRADSEKIYEAVFDGALSNLDVFSRYAGAEEARRNRAKRDGFGGIGIRFRVQNRVATVTSVMVDTPAAVAGMLRGDVITHVDGVSLSGMATTAITKKLRGPTHTDVNVTVRRGKEGRNLTFTITRAHIVPETVVETRANGIATYKLTGFNQDTARSLAEKLKKAKDDAENPVNGIVLDLRGNPGGLLKQSVKVADLLLTQGHIVSTKGRHPDSLHVYEAGGSDLANGLPVLVVIDGKSASAAEIVAAALQDRERAVVIGTSSYGKGTVQTVIRLPNDGEITLTWSRLMTPSGYALHGLGVLPVVCTSNERSEIGDIVDGALSRRLQARSRFQSWRTPGVQARDRRNELRRSCPSQRRNTDLELKVARHIIGTPATYDKALAISAAYSEARQQ